MPKWFDHDYYMKPPAIGLRYFGNSIVEGMRGIQEEINILTNYRNSVINTAIDSHLSKFEKWIIRMIPRIATKIIRIIIVYKNGGDIVEITKNGKVIEEIDISGIKIKVED